MRMSCVSQSRNFQTDSTFGGSLHTARRTAFGHGGGSGAFILDSVSATRLCSDGKWPMLNAFLHASCRAITSIDPRPFNLRPFCSADELCPSTATSSALKKLPQTNNANNKVRNPQERLMRWVCR